MPCSRGDRNARALDCFGPWIVVVRLKREDMLIRCRVGREDLMEWSARWICHRDWNGGRYSCHQRRMTPWSWSVREADIGVMGWDMTGDGRGSHLAPKGESWGAMLRKRDLFEQK